MIKTLDGGLKTYRDTLSETQLERYETLSAFAKINENESVVLGSEYDQEMYSSD